MATMGMGSGLGSDDGRRGGTVLSEINVTPFVDVMLVLLVIFMVTAPLLSRPHDVDLPRVDMGNLETAEGPLELTVHPDGTVSVGSRRMPVEELVERLPAILEHRRDRRLLVLADGRVKWATLSQVYRAARDAGVDKVSMPVAPAPPTGARRPDGGG